MRFPWRCVLVIATVMAGCLLLAACGGGEGDLPGPEKSDEDLERALRTMAEDDLAIMVLPQEELGDEFGGLAVAEDSGFVDNEEAAERTMEPYDTADDIEQGGYVTGYFLTHVAPNTLALLVAGEGVIRLSTEVSLFESPGAASDFMAKRLEQVQQLEGTEIADGLILQEVETLAVEGLGDEVIGGRIRFGAQGAELYGTHLVFRLDRLLGQVVQYRADDTNVDSQVQEIGQALEKRIRGVLLGDITAMPVPVAEGEYAGWATDAVAELERMSASAVDSINGMAEGSLDEGTGTRELGRLASQVGDLHEEAVGLRAPEGWQEYHGALTRAIDLRASSLEALAEAFDKGQAEKLQEAMRLGGAASEALENLPPAPGQ